MIQDNGFTRRNLLSAMAVAPALVSVPALAETPRRGGRIRVAGISSSNSDTLDPARGNLSTDFVRHFMFYSGLMQYDSRLLARPALAEAMDSTDYQTWRIRLRRGVTFHDGGPLTAADVVYSLLRHKNPATASSVISIAEQFAEVRATGRYEVIIRLAAPNVDLPVIFCDSHFLIIRNGTRNFRTANGTGPYICKEFSPGVRSISVRNPNYWKPGRPYLDEIEFFGISDEQARVNALLAGDVQLIGSVGHLSIARVRASARHAIHATKSGNFTDLVMQQSSPISGNPDFVLAMKYLFDRKLINRALLSNLGSIANDHPIPAFNPYAANDLPQRQFDLDRARYHLKRSGFEGLRIPVYASPAAAGSVDMASVLQEYAHRINLKLAVNRVPSDGYWSTHWKKHPLTFSNINPRPTADIIFTLFMKSDSSQNESGWKNKRFDQMLLEARGSKSEERRRLLYGDMQEMVRDHCGLVIPVFLNLTDGFDRRLRGLGSIPTGGLMGYSFSEYVWWTG